MSFRDFGQRFLLAMNKGDFEATAEMLDPEFVVEEAAGLPYAGTYHGIAGWRTLCEAVIRTWAQFDLKLLEFLGETSDSLVVKFAISGRSRQTQRPFETTVLELWRFRDGRLLRIDPYYFDTHLLAIANDAQSPNA